MSPRIKRPRGGQPGNQNARKHGFFSSSMSPEEICEFWQCLKTGSGDSDRELIAFRIRLCSALRASPGNQRIIKEASRRLFKWACSQNTVASRQEKAEAAKFIRFACSEISRQYPNTNELKTPETAEIMTNRIAAES